MIGGGLAAPSQAAVPPLLFFFRGQTVVLKSPFAGVRWRLAGGLMGTNANRSIRIGLDVGGTKIFAIGVDLDVSHSPSVLFSRSVPTQADCPEKFFDRLADFLRDVLKEGQEKGWVADVRIGVGMPGRYIPSTGGGRVIATGTAPNLGVNPNDFDGVNPERELSRRLPGFSFCVHNDAVAQMRFVLDLLLRQESTSSVIKGRRVCYLGPGTGLGGGFAEVGPTGPVEIRTDGHVFDIVIEPGGVTVPFVVQGMTIAVSRGGTAEELVSGKAINALMTEIDQKLVQNGQPPLFSPLGLPGGLLLDRCLMGEVGDEHAREMALQIARFEGRMLGRVMEKIYRGAIEKTDRRAVWPEDDVRFVRGISTFVLGGSVPRGWVGDVLRESALAELAERVPGTPFSLLSPPAESGNAGALGAALLAGTIPIH